MAHRIDGPGATADLHFTEGSPSPSGYVAPTQVTADWANMVQEEIISVLTAAGVAPVKANNAQLAAAIAQLIAAQAVEVGPATETEAGIVELATSAEAIAGTDALRAVTPATLAGAISGAVRGYTRQQYAEPVVLVDQAGAVALDAWLHQDVDITAIDAVSFAAPEHSARGMYMTMTLRAATALGIAWDTTVYKESRSSNALTPDVTLPTAFVAGKAMILQFRCIDGARWLLMGKCEEA